MPRVFGEFHRIVSHDDFKLNLNHAIIHEGNIIATNGYVISMSPLTAWGLSEDSKKNAEGKAIHYNELRVMSLSKWSMLEFTESEIVLTGKRGDIIRLQYAATMSDKETMSFTAIGTYKNNGVWRYPFYKRVIPSDDDFGKRSFSKFAISPSFIYDMMLCFVSREIGLYVFEFSNEKESHEFPRSIIMMRTEEDLDKERLYVMPRILNL